ncbi:MAG: sulfite exporter TauE/SafE family protein [Gammaproteobacteria bacterium]
MLTTLLIYVAVGGIVGILAGLLGIGGGGIIVPILVYLLPQQGVPHEIIMHLALGTALASIIFTSLSSLRAHHQRGAVNWLAFRRLAGGILIGTFLGSCFASILSTTFLISFFVFFLYFISIQLLTNRKPKPSRELPGTPAMSGVGAAIGFVSSLVGIGGGSLSVPFLIWCNIKLHHAIGTSAALGLPIAVAGAVGYIFVGWNTPGLPDFSIGFVYLPGLLSIAAVSMLTAPLGAKLAHSLPVNKLRKIFALLLIAIATKMLFDSL